MSDARKNIAQRVADAGKALSLRSSTQTLAVKAKAAVDKVLADWNAIQLPQGYGQFGLESLGEVVPERNRSFQAATDADPTLLMRDMKEMKMSDRHIAQVTESCMVLFDKSYDPTSIIRDMPASNADHAKLSTVIGRTAAATWGGNDTVGIEAFGDDINRLATDDRLTMSLMIMRPWENIMDKGLARVNDASPVVTIRIPSPEAWDWATTQQANSTAEQRNGSGNTYRLRDLYRNPTPVNSSAKRIVPVAANDSKQQLFGGTTEFYKTATEVSLLDLSRNTNVVTYDHVDRTDLVSDGAVLEKVIVSITDPNNGNPKTENFLLVTRPFDQAMFVRQPTNKASGAQQSIMDAVLPINKDTKQWDGSASTIAAKLTDAKIEIKLNITATLNIQTGIVRAAGTTATALRQIKGGPAISNATQTYYGTLSSNVVAYSVDAKFDEENQRKANLAVWVQYYEQQFVVPRSRIYFTDYSLSQDVDENAISATSSVMALGSGRRGLDVIVNALNDISEGLDYATRNPEVALANAMDDRSFASALVKPTVVSTVLDYEEEEINTMNESTRLSEIHGRFRARLLQMLSMLFAKSLMLNQYKPGEKPVIKCWVHSSIADVVIGILDYHPTLNDTDTIATGADYTMVLPNGYRLDVIKSNFDCLQNRLYAVPVIESDMTSVLSAASIRDCGTVTTNYTPTNHNAVVRRVATTTRDIVMMSNKVGVMMEIKGLGNQLGEYGFAKVELNQDFNEAMAA